MHDSQKVNQEIIVFLFISIFLILVNTCHDKKRYDMINNQIDRGQITNLLKEDYYIYSHEKNVSNILNNQMNKDKTINLLAIDYLIYSSENGYLKLKIRNNKVMAKLLEIKEPVIIINNTIGRSLIAKGMTIVSSELPHPCDYVFTIDIEKRTVLFDDECLLVLASIKKFGF